MPYPLLRQTDRSHGDSRLMKVNGRGKVQVSPDRAKIQVGVVTQDENLEKAQKDNAAKIEQIRDQLVAAGVPKENIQTADYFIFPEYDYMDGKQIFRGYQVTHTLSLTIDDISQTGYIIDTAVANGANRVSNIEFTVKNSYEHEQQALRIALGNALANAQTIANTMGLKLDQTPVKIIDVDIPPTGPVKPFSKTQVMSASAAPVEPGTLEAVATVEVHFQYFS